MIVMEKSFAILDTSMTSGLFANLFLAVALGASMKRMWSLLNTLQIVTHITLLAITLPSNVGICLRTIVEVSNVQVVPKTWVDKVVLTVRSWTSELNEAASGYEEGSFMDNIGQVIFVSILLAGVVSLVGLLHLASKYSLR